MAASTFREASFTAARMRSWSISTSSGFTASRSRVMLMRLFWPSMVTLTMPPPALASTTRAAISACMRSWACWSCFISFWGFKGPPVFGSSRSRRAHVDEAAVEQAHRLADGGVGLGLLAQASAGGLGLGGGRSSSGSGGGDLELCRSAEDLREDLAVLVGMRLGEDQEVGADPQIESGVGL